MAYQITFWDITDGYVEINFDGSDPNYMPENVIKCLLKYGHIPAKTIHWDDDHGPLGKTYSEEEVDMHIEQYKQYSAIKTVSELIALG